MPFFIHIKMSSPMKMKNKKYLLDNSQQCIETFQRVVSGESWRFDHSQNVHEKTECFLKKNEANLSRLFS